MDINQVQDIHLMYNAIYNSELREKANEYNSMIRDDDIVEVATEYFYTYGLNSNGIDILIEKVGLNNFVEFVYDLSENLVVLTEARAAKKRTGGESYAEVKAKIDAKEAAKKAAKEAAKKRTKSERTEPESEGPDTEAKKEQSKSSKPVRDAIARGILGAVERARRDVGLLGQSFNTAREVGREHERRVARAAGTVAAGVHGAAKFAHRAGQEFGRSEMGKKIKGVAEEVDTRRAPRELLDRLNTSREGHMAQDGPNRPAYDAKQRLLQKAHERRNKMKEQVDVYDIILSHLLDEGYADTNEAAVAIMANMSEEWKDEIVDKMLDEANRAERELKLTSRQREQARNLHQYTGKPIFYGTNPNRRKKPDSSDPILNKSHKYMTAKRQASHTAGRNLRGDTGEGGNVVRSRYQANKDHKDGYPSIRGVDT